MIIIKQNKISDSTVGISIPPDIDALIDDNSITGTHTAIEVRDLHNLVNKTYSQIETSDLTPHEKQHIISSLKTLIQSLPKPTLGVIKGAALSIEVLANYPEAYKTANELINFITIHFK